MLRRYIENRDAKETQHEQTMADLKLRCEDLEKRTELLKQFSSHFFEERKAVREISLTALDKAIEFGDDQIAGIALAILGNEYKRDFFGLMNRI